MKIAILTSGIMPVPAVQGGAVETLIDFYLAYNNRHKLHDITVYSVEAEGVKQHAACLSEVNHYHFIDTRSLVARLLKRWYKYFCRNGYYDYTIEYYFAQALRHLKRQDYDMVIIENRPGFAPRLAKKTQARIVLHLHNDFLNKDIPQARAIYEAADRIVTVSDYIGSRVKTIDPNSNKCVTVGNGIDLQAFSKEHACQISRSQIGLQPADFVLVYSGRITREKGIVQLIEAMQQLKEYANLKLLVMGSSFYGNANDSHNPFIASLKEAAKSLEERIVFTGYVPYQQMPSYLQLADVAVIPSQWEEPFGLTCIEAMAMSLPVIVSHRGGLPEMVTPDNAIILPTDQTFVSRLADAILSLYRHRERCKPMGQASWQLSRKYDKDRFAEEFLEISNTWVNE